jgi:hypothetical protein
LIVDDPGWGEYQSKATRTIPVVALIPATSGPPTAGSFAETLQQIYDAFRRELALIRREFASAGPSLGANFASTA